MSAAERLAALFLTPLAPASAGSPAATPTDAPIAEPVDVARPPIDTRPPSPGSAVGPEAGAVASAPPRLRVVATLGSSTVHARPGSGAGRPGVRRKPRPGTARDGGVAPPVPPRPFLARTGEPPVLPGAVPGVSAPAQSGGEHRPGTGASGLRVCVVGGGPEGWSFARALCARLARLPGARCAVLCLPPRRVEGRPPRGSGLPAPAARRLARQLAGVELAATVRGRVVEAAPAPGAEGFAALADLLATVEHHAPETPIITLLGGARGPGDERFIGGQDVVLALVPDPAAPALGIVAAAELSGLAPGAVVRAVALPARLGLARRRAAVASVVEELR